MKPIRPWLAALAIVALYALVQQLDGPDDLQAARDVADDLAIAVATAGSQR
jgi:hypothetical protein